MKIITLETLKTMPNGTVFCEIDKWGNLSEQICILTGRFDKMIGFNGVMNLCPWVAADENGEHHSKMLDDNNELMKNKSIPTEYVTNDTSHHDYEPNQLFCVFSKSEVERTIKVLKWALSGLEDDFGMDEVLE